jgi:hypothetical protein
MKKQPPKVTYKFLKPKNRKEAEEAELRLSRAYEMLFEHFLNSKEWLEFIQHHRGDSK